MRSGRIWMMAVVPLVVVTSIVGFSWTSFVLPDPSSADRHGLVRWLVLRDLRVESQEVQLALLDGLQRNFSDGDSLRADDSELSESLENRLQANIAFLQEFWFYTRCDQLSQLDLEVRDAFLDAQIRFAEKWGDLAPSEDQVDVFDLIDAWIRDADGDQKRNAENGVRIALGRFLQTRSLAEYPGATQLELADRIVEDLEYGTNVGGFVESASSEQQAQLRENAAVLTRVWLTREAVRYQALSAANRAKYLNQRIQQFKQWNLLALINGPSGGADTAALVAFASKAQQWIDEADEESKPALQLLLRDVSQRILLGGLN